MAGSYKHIIESPEDESGNRTKGGLVDFDRFQEMIEKPSDAYKTVEEMYGMIWFLADALRIHGVDRTSEEIIEMARQNWTQGVLESPSKHKRD